MKSYAFLFWAYTVIWIGLAAYIALLIARLRRAAARLERAEAELERRTSVSD